MPPAIWTHEESNPEDTFIGTLETCQLATWGSIPPAEAARRARALMLMTLQAARLKNTPPPSNPKYGSGPVLGDYKASQYADETDLWVASTVLRTPALLLDLKPGQKGITAVSIATQDGGAAIEVYNSPPKGPEESGALPAIVIVAGLVLGAVAIIAVAHDILNVIDRNLARENDAKELARAQGAAISLIAAKAEQDKKAGKPTAWDPQALQQIDILFQRQKAVAARKEVPLPEPFVGAIESAGKAASEAMQGAGKGAATALDSLGSMLPFLAIGAVALVLLKGNSAAQPAPQYVQVAPPPALPQRRQIIDAEFEEVAA